MEKTQETQSFARWNRHYFEQIRLDEHDGWRYNVLNNILMEMYPTRTVSKMGMRDISISNDNKASDLKLLEDTLFRLRKPHAQVILT